MWKSYLFGLVIGDCRFKKMCKIVLIICYLQVEEVKRRFVLNKLLKGYQTLLYRR